MTIRRGSGLNNGGFTGESIRPQGYQFPVGLTRLTANNAVGSSLSPAPAGAVAVTGSNVAWTFTASGTFTPNFTGAVEALIVAGGGAGGTSDCNSWSGAGGAGGLVYHSAYPVVSGTSYTATVGTGGSSPSYPTIGRGGNGNPSSLSGSGSPTMTAVGGGGGGGFGGPLGSGQDPNGGANGGSGGGAAAGYNGPFSGGSSTQSPSGGGTGYGSSGGGMPNGFQPHYGGGGGGGAGGSGDDGSGTGAFGGAGGAGLTYAISGSSVGYAGGGGGGGNTLGPPNGNPITRGVPFGGGSPGPAAGSVPAPSTNGGNGAANRGGGGSAAKCNYNGGYGGSGVVIIKSTLLPDTYRVD